MTQKIKVYDPTFLPSLMAKKHKGVARYTKVIEVIQYQLCILMQSHFVKNVNIFEQDLHTSTLSLDTFGKCTV